MVNYINYIKALVFKDVPPCSLPLPTFHTKSLLLSTRLSVCTMLTLHVKDF